MHLPTVYPSVGRAHQMNRNVKVITVKENKTWVVSRKNGSNKFIAPMCLLNYSNVNNSSTTLVVTKCLADIINPSA